MWLQGISFFVCSYNVDYVKEINKKMCFSYSTAIRSIVDYSRIGPDCEVKTRKTTDIKSVYIRCLFVCL